MHEGEGKWRWALDEGEGEWRWALDEGEGEWPWALHWVTEQLANRRRRDDEG